MRTFSSQAETYLMLQSGRKEDRKIRLSIHSMIPVILKSPSNWQDILLSKNITIEKRRLCGIILRTCTFVTAI